MTVRELIEKLEHMPMDATVLVDASDLNVLGDIVAVTVYRGDIVLKCE